MISDIYNRILNIEFNKQNLPFEVKIYSDQNYCALVCKNCGLHVQSLLFHLSQNPSSQVLSGFFDFAHDVADYQ